AAPCGIAFGWIADCFGAPFSGQPGIAETADTNSPGEYRATLQACSCHRCVLRCGRFHSGAEGTNARLARSGKPASGFVGNGCEKRHVPRRKLAPGAETFR